MSSYTDGLSDVETNNYAITTSNGNKRNLISWHVLREVQLSFTTVNVMAILQHLLVYPNCSVANTIEPYVKIAF